MRYVKQTVSALSVALISIASAYVMDADEVMGEEVYNVQLKVETVEVDINEIPENREVRVGVSIDNNPGFLVLYYLLEIDNRLKYHSFDRIETDLSQFCAGFSEAFSNEKIWRISNIFIKSDNIYYDNDEILIIKFFLPDEVKIGDYYEIKLLSEYHNGDDNWTSGFARENVIGEDCGPENFAPFINGGIRIVGQEPEPVQEPPQESEPPVQPSEDIAPPQPAGDNQQNNNVQQQFIAETAAPVTEATTMETTTATTSTTTVTTVPETTKIGRAHV